MFIFVAYILLKIFINQLLESKCQEHGFYFISNANIGLDDIFDGLHVNNLTGHKKLKHNILKMCAKTYVHEV